MSKERFSSQPRGTGLRKKFGVGARENVASDVPSDVIASTTSPTSDTTPSSTGTTTAADVTIEVPRDARAGVAVDDRASRTDILWIHAADLIAIHPRPPAEPVASGQRDHDPQRRGQGAGVNGATASRRARRAKPRTRKRGAGADLESSRDDPSDRREQGPWFTAAEAAVHLALPSAKAVYQAARRGEIPAYKFGKRLRFRREELDAILLSGRVLTPFDDGLSSITRRPLAGEGR